MSMIFPRNLVLWKGAWRIWALNKISSSSWCSKTTRKTSIRSQLPTSLAFFDNLRGSKTSTNVPSERRDTACIDWPAEADNEFNLSISRSGPSYSFLCLSFWWLLVSFIRFLVVVMIYTSRWTLQWSRGLGIWAASPPSDLLYHKKLGRPTPFLQSDGMVSSQSKSSNPVHFPTFHVRIFAVNNVAILYYDIYHLLVSSHLSSIWHLDLLFVKYWKTEKQTHGIRDPLRWDVRCEMRECSGTRTDVR